MFTSKEEPEHIICTLMVVKHYHESIEEHQSVQIVDLKDGTCHTNIDNSEKNSGRNTSGKRIDGVGSDNLSAPSGDRRSAAGESKDLSGFDDDFMALEGVSFISSLFSNIRISQNGASRANRDDGLKAFLRRFHRQTAELRRER